MDNIYEEHQTLLEIQNEYLQNLIEKGLSLENSGQYDKALNLYKRGYNMSDDTTVRSLFSSFILGLLD